MAAITLYALTYSPWSEKARWALDHHGISYKKREYAPLFGAPGLKWKTGRWKQKVTVPLLITGKQHFGDSMEIARYAEKNGKGTPLLQEESDAIDRWNQISEEALAAGRALLTYRVAQDRTAMQDYLPRWVPSWLGYSLGIGLARIGIAYFRKKYNFQESQPDLWMQTLRQHLETMAEALRNKPYILESFSYADIAMSAVLQFVQPVAWPTIRTPKRSQHCWGTPELAQTFPALLSWRDALYKKHRDQDSI